MFEAVSQAPFLGVTWECYGNLSSGNNSYKHLGNYSRLIETEIKIIFVAVFVVTGCTT